jgi:hypothetical protein
MKRALGPFILLTCGFLLLNSTAYATVDWQIIKTLELKQAFIDVAVTPDGRWTFALTAEGDVLIYSAAGKLEGTLNVQGKFDKISTSANGDKIYLSDQEAATLKIIAVEFVKEIDTNNAPFKGPADAPVTIAVFNDFQ